MYDIKLQIRAPELTDAINRLAVAMSGGKIEAPPPAPAEPDPQPVAEIPAAADIPAATFEEVHAALLELKAQKKAAAVREVLTAIGAKTVQDIPADKYAEALRLVKAKLEG